MEASVLRRLEELRGEYALGVRRMQELSRELEATRDTVLRIGGAIQVLEELLAGGSPAAGDAPTVGAASAG